MFASIIYATTTTSGMWMESTHSKKAILLRKEKEPKLAERQKERERVKRKIERKNERTKERKNERTKERKKERKIGKERKKNVKEMKIKKSFSIF